MKKINWFGNTSKKGPLFKPVKLPTKQSVSKIPKKNLTWPQAVKRYPKVKMFGDADKDGKLNMFDCKPFDKNRHGKFKQNVPIDKAKYVTIYHGTGKDAVKKILKEGLKSSGVERNFDISKRGYSYSSPSKYSADNFGRMVYGKKNKRLVKITISKDELEKMKEVTKKESSDYGIQKRIIAQYNKTHDNKLDKDTLHAYNELMSDEDIPAEKIKIVENPEVESYKDYKKHYLNNEESPEALKSLEEANNEKD